jgi:hypothetical protein
VLFLLGWSTDNLLCHFWERAWGSGERCLDCAYLGAGAWFIWDHLELVEFREVLRPSPWQNEAGDWWKPVPRLTLYYVPRVIGHHQHIFVLRLLFSLRIIFLLLFFHFSGFPSGSYERDWFVSSGEDILCYKHTEWAVFGK